ncbi:MAG: PEP-CTERM sorting domain-containing protein [Calothrix sp. MO_167.B12]|nr:PEP-CTERM sorting domain-containing protein [Calothrix sp. MO_167.B12]
MNKIISAITFGCTLLIASNPVLAQKLTLYDGSSGVTPDNSSPQWLSFGNLGGATQNAAGGVTNLDTSGNNLIYAGYSNYNTSTTPSLVNNSFPTLDRSTGYNLSFTVKINSQANDGANAPNRAGFSVTVLSSDRKGIEIGFRNSDFFYQTSSSFDNVKTSSVDSSTASNLLSNLNQYDLSISGDKFSLSAGGTSIFSNENLVDYTAASGLVNTDIYRLPNALFLGDNTTSARANISLQNVSLTTNNAAVPYDFSPSMGILALAACGGVNYLLKKKKE